MVEEQVVKEIITDKMIDAGKQLTEALDDNPEITVRRHKKITWTFVGV